MTIPENDQGSEAAGSGESIGHTPDGDEPIPLMQRILDNPFMLLFLGVAFPAVLYLIWGVIEIASIPIGN